MKSARKEPSQRQLRVGQEIRKILIDTIESGDLWNPLLLDKTISITQVDISPDLKNCDAYIMTLGGEGVEDVVKGLNEARNYIRRLVGKELTIRYTPAIRFKIDETFEQAAKINKILLSPEVSRDLTKKETEEEEI